MPLLVVTNVRPDGESTDHPVATSIFVNFNRALDCATLFEDGNVIARRVGARKPLPLQSTGCLPPGPVST